MVMFLFLHCRRRYFLLLLQLVERKKTEVDIFLFNAGASFLLAVDFVPIGKPKLW